MTITKVIPLISPKRMMASSQQRSVTMKSIKWMLLGIALILTGIGTLLGYAVVGVSGLEVVGLLCPVIGLIVCILGMTRED